MLYNKILIWGDSLIKGIIFDPAKNRHTTLKENGVQYAAQKLSLDVVNRSKFGCTTTHGVSILHEDLLGGLSGDAALMEFGGNDCDHHWEAIAQDPHAHHQPKTPLAKFKQMLMAMVQMLRQKKITPVLMSIPPIDAQRYFEFFSRNGLNKNNILHFLGEVEHIYRWQEMYSNAVSALAAALKCPFINLREAFLLQPNYKHFLCDDGIHLNHEGQRLMGDVFIDFFHTAVQNVS
ncbi:MAG: SGNH/GDSL hydrolase family protein [Christensenellales bacterium]